MKSVVIIEGSTVHALVFFILLLTVRRNRMFFSLKPSASEGELGNNQTNTQTHSLTDWCFDKNSAEIWIWDHHFFLYIKYLYEIVIKGFSMPKLTKDLRDKFRIEKEFCVVIWHWSSQNINARIIRFF